MKKQSILIGVVASTLLLTGCNLLAPNNQNNNQSTNHTKNQNTHQDGQSNQNHQQNTNDQGSYIYDKNTREYYAQIWLTDRDNLSVFTSMNDVSYTPIDASGTLVNPYNPDATVNYPDGTIVLSPSVTAAGSVTFRDNNDGTVTFFDAPGHFHDDGWFEDDFSLRESQKIIDQGRTVTIKNSAQSDINYVAQYITHSTPEPSAAEAFEGFDVERPSSSSSDDSDTSVTRDNVIDLVEDYEGEYLDTDTYTFKEPEQQSDGSWGFSIIDKATGELAGSYIIDPDGTVTKYDENGDPE
ncbi:hypothetical protein C7J88_07405 [Staphylococcus muscae]|uniref:Lipoprotein n=1 Tax=Staphylococcus muscae TaxID=1294 RepID=A0A240BS92_9STAP|nr:hypothetical protein [Staphylococcus muscae]AVQ34012.1 hypothetical protein C7J88_07405 [Staphylococcus muscae]PNZ04495.1 hypothetical protein CD131_04415 [Staphylococcus muscae]GGA82479.1 hypothetical protein GCM10007183_03360 [Staphylococcus muscae]SNV98309.1 lipoprotein [Staphylococcus muscae]